jgi:hypothetical protein
MKKCISVIAAGVLLVGVVFAEDYPKAETFLGYTYIRFAPATDLPPLSAHGGGGQFSYNFNRWLSGVVDLGAVHNGSYAAFQADTTAFNFMAGPRATFRRGRWAPFVQGVFGGVYFASSLGLNGFLDASSPIFVPGLTVPGLPVTARLNNSQTRFAMAIGGGLDVKISRHVAFRPFEVDYYYTRLDDQTRFGNLLVPGDNHQNNLRAMAGFTFMFGGENPAPAPATKTCPDGKVVLATAPCPKQSAAVSVIANPTEICQGESSQVNASINGGGDKSQMSMAWSVNGQTVSQDPSFIFNSTNREPGTYQVGVTVHGPSLNPSTAATTITVKPYMPPTGTASANPAQIYAGEKSTLSASCTGQCGGPIQAPTFTASDGTVQGDQFDSSSIQWDSSNNAEQRKTVTVTASCSDSRSVGTATTQIEVIKKATIAPVRLPDVLFRDNSSRVNNCGKRILLEQLRSYYERDNTGTVVLVGHSSPDEKAANLAAERALNSAAVITAATGVCLSIPQSQVQVSSPGTDQNGVPFDSSFCGNSVGAGSSSEAEMRRVVVWFVPTGAQIPVSATNAQSAASLNVGSLGCPK